VALAWALGVLAGREFERALTPAVAWLIAIGLFLPTVVLHRSRHPQWATLLLLLTAGLGTLFYLQARLPVERLYPLLEGLRTVRGWVVSYPTERPERTSFLLRPERLPGRLQIFYYHPYGRARSIHYGDLLELEGRFEVPWQFEDFDYRGYLRSRGVWGIGSLWSAKQIRRLAEGGGHPLLRWGDRARQRLFDLIDRYVPDSGSALLKGLLFGERAYLSREIESSFRDAGVMHVLAVSGLHLGILIGLFWGPLRWLGFSLTRIYLTLIPFVLVYLALVGFKVSLVRASLMFGFVGLGGVVAERGWILRRWIDPLQGLAAAGLAILISTPQALFDVSFQLSFAATSGILIALQLALPYLRAWDERLRLRWATAPCPWRRALFKLSRGAAIFLLISMAAQLAVAPVLAYHFHRVYLGALLANLIVVPWVTVTLWIGVFVLLAGFFVPPLAQGLGALEGQLLAGLIHLTQFFARLPWAYLIVDRGVQLTALVTFPLLLAPEVLGGLRLFSLWWLRTRS